MIDDLAKGLTGFKDLGVAPDRRFVLSAWLPSLVFWAAIAGLIVAAWGPAATLSWWSAHGGEVRLALLALGLGLTVLTALILTTLLGPLIRFYEGYWDRLPFGPHLARGRQAHHRGVLQSLAAQLPTNQSRISLTYPPPDLPEFVMPTRLGNVLRNAELYPLVRYEIDAVLVWPRLYYVLPEAFAKALGSAKANLDLMIVISFLGYLFAWVGGSVALACLPFYATPACFAAGVLVAWIGYEGAVQAALPYAQLIKVAFDLHRGTLLKGLSLREPNSYGEEKQRWRQIGNLWYHGAPEGAAGAAAIGYPERKAPEKNTVGGELKVDLALSLPASPDGTGDGQGEESW
jgi:hypothetical protein